MTVKSMTGFGRGEAASRGLRVQVELSSVNRKQLDVRVNLPKFLAPLESGIVKQIARSISRGSVAASVSLNVTGACPCAACVDEEAAAAFVAALRKTAEKLGLPDDLSAQALLHIPDVVRRGGPDPDTENAWPVVRTALRHALKRLQLMRTREGEAIAKDLTRRLSHLGCLLERIGRRAPRVTERYRRSLLKKLESSGVKQAPHDQQFVREVMFFVDRCDISEEITRLDSHLAQAVALLSSGKSAGRALDFLAQEMFREINTIGSKANDEGISRHVVTFKTELECVREQSQNVE